MIQHTLFEDNNGNVYLPNCVKVSEKLIMLRELYKNYNSNCVSMSEQYVANHKRSDFIDIINSQLLIKYQEL